MGEQPARIVGALSVPPGDVVVVVPSAATVNVAMETASTNRIKPIANSFFMCSPRYSWED